jgi:hypothetical protein
MDFYKRGVTVRNECSLKSGSDTSMLSRNFDKELLLVTAQLIQKNVVLCF